ncbi:hypothetical protein CR513_12482, partial [Mucuna pruriens]
MTAFERKRPYMKLQASKLDNLGGFGKLRQISTTSLFWAQPISNIFSYFNNIIKVITTKYRVERVLVDLGSSANVEIRGIVDLRTTFGVGPDAKAITVKFTVVNA